MWSVVSIKENMTLAKERQHIHVSHLSVTEKLADFILHYGS